MFDEIYSYEPAKGHGLKHDPLASILGPRPIGWISTRSVDGHSNLAPYSFFNVFNYKPPIVAFSSVGWKDTIRNVQETGEFVVNLATRNLAKQVNLTSAEVPADTDEFLLANLTPLPCTSVSVARVAESPVALECRLLGMHQLRDLGGNPVETWLALGQITAVHIAKLFLKDGVYDPGVARPILRGGGTGDYFEIKPDALFQMPRPK
ncbi:flavin reductase family protein [Burkholderia sp. AU30198]|uniref:flavin reductase family protein n=1 Tax=Burkholderia sp. AU30198 TaxID=2879627 RepID=UPI001CF4FAFC|nr:flavin reductase family protein [Burkholderia sp. AU30198]MCA8299233.1 flavin reductase family protein [Burkholderia sp. AU30198]